MKKRIRLTEKQLYTCIRQVLNEVRYNEVTYGDKHYAGVCSHSQSPKYRGSYKNCPYDSLIKILGHAIFTQALEDVEKEKEWFDKINKKDRDGKGENRIYLTLQFNDVEDNICVCVNFTYYVYDNLPQEFTIGNIDVCSQYGWERFDPWRCSAAEKEYYYDIFENIETHLDAQAIKSAVDQEVDAESKRDPLSRWTRIQ